MRAISTVWYRLFQVIAFLAVAIAAFEFGILWQEHHADDAIRRKAGKRQVHAGSANKIRTSIRAEFNPQSALLIGANEMVRYQQVVFKEMVRAIVGRIPIIGFVNNEDEAELGKALLEEAGLPIEAVHFIVHPLDSMWLRDFGPIFTRWSDGEVKMVDARFGSRDTNSPRRLDDKFTKYVGEVLGLEVDTLPLTIEGGNLLSNGDGLMVTSTAVIGQPENRQYSLEDIGRLLQTHLGCRTWVYVRTPAGEPTAHVDMYMSFLRRNLAVVASIDPAYDAASAEILDEMASVLAGQTTSMGPMQVERIPMPPRTPEGHWRSYCNILTVNGVILMPSYKDVDPAMEQRARETYERLMPSWTIALIPADTLVPKRGVLHCIGIGVPGYVDVKPLIDNAL